MDEPADAPEEGAGEQPSRAASLGHLLAEQRAAAEARDWGRAAALNREIATLSAGSPADPARETTNRRIHADVRS